MVSAGLMGSKLPVTGSHEGAGTVVALGSSVTDFQKGDRVLASLMYNRCGSCSVCLGPANMIQYCPKRESALGISRDGAFAEYEIIDSRETCLLPKELSFVNAAPLACAGCTVWTGIVRTGLREGQWLAIVGSGGGLGHLAVQFAKARGLRVIGVDARDEGLALSRECGADATIDVRWGLGRVVQEVRNIVGGERADATLNLSDADAAAGVATAVTRDHGRMIQIAQPPAKFTIPFNELILRDIKIEGSLYSNRPETQEMLDVMVKHKLYVKTNPVYGIEKIPELIEFAHSGKMAGKGVVIIDEGAVNLGVGKRDHSVRSQSFAAKI